MSIVKRIDTKSVHRICSGQVVADLGASVKVPHLPLRTPLPQLFSRNVLAECHCRRAPDTTIHLQRPAHSCRRLLRKHRLGCNATSVVKGAKLLQHPPCCARVALIQRSVSIRITSMRRERAADAGAGGERTGCRRHIH